MKRDFEFVTFDCYGTLIDWERGIAGACCRAAEGEGLTVDPGEILRLHAEIEPRVQTGSYRPYREVLTEVAGEIGQRIGARWDRRRAEFLAESVPEWEPFPDVNPALERLQGAGLALGILSNIDDDLLEGTLRHFSVHFDLLVTAQQVRSYKPAHPHFERAREKIGGRRWLHAAQSSFHDVASAVALEIPVVWVNRRGERAAGQAAPTAEVADLTGLAEWLGVE